MINVIASGSEGNAVLYHDSILVDCGVSFEKIKPYLHDIQLVLLTHKHKDHINIETLNKLRFERPTLRIGCCEWMLDEIHNARTMTYGRNNVDSYEPGILYQYDRFSITPVELYHDVDNCGYRIITEDYKIFHATDTAHLEGIEAKDYDLYAIEHNYDEDTVEDIIARNEATGNYSHKKGTINTHLSEQQARDFIFKNKVRPCKVVRLHESNTNY